MSWANVERAEWAVDAGAAAVFAAAVGFAFGARAPGAGPATAAAVAAFMVAHLALRQVRPAEPIRALPDFELQAIAPMPEHDAAADELILEDELGEVSPHARVVRLFGASQSHLRHSRPAPPDASQALSEALAELRRSLR